MCEFITTTTCPPRYPTVPVFKTDMYCAWWVNSSIGEEHFSSPYTLGWRTHTPTLLAELFHFRLSNSPVTTGFHVLDKSAESEGLLLKCNWHLWTCFTLQLSSHRRFLCVTVKICTTHLLHGNSRKNGKRHQEHNQCVEQQHVIMCFSRGENIKDATHVHVITDTLF